MFIKWLQLRREGVPLPLWTLFGMCLRRTLTDEVVKAVILNGKNDLALTLDTIESHAMCGGHISDVAEVLLKAKQQGLDMDPMPLLALDLIGEAPVKIFDEYVEAHEADRTLGFAEIAARYISTSNS
jgi:uncharacterized protein YqfA (UPF0365 family)